MELKIINDQDQSPSSGVFDKIWSQFKAFFHVGQHQYYLQMDLMEKAEGTPKDGRVAHLSFSAVGNQFSCKFPGNPK